MKQKLVSALVCVLAVVAMVGCFESRRGPGRRSTPAVTSTVLVGKEAPDFALKTGSGENFNLSASRGRKAVVLGVGNPFG